MNQPLLSVNNLTHLYAPGKGFSDVSFDLWGEHSPIGDIAIKKEDLKLIPKMDAEINERIKAKFDK